jgi:FAD/FMN-containing dehydrogenase
MLLEKLKAIVGPGGWTCEPEELKPHLTEWRNAFRGETRIMVSPSTTDEVSRVVSTCASERVGIVPQGGNTGLCGGAIPDATGDQVLLSTARLNRIRSINPQNYSMVVEAGCILSTIQDKAREHDRFFPLSLAAEGSCQIGGNLSTNAGGINVIRYGTARRHVLGLEVVLADGTIWDGLRSLRKDTAGYDMKQVFIGSEGTLGIITAASLRLYPDPGEMTTAFVAIRSAHQSVDLLAALRTSLADRIQAFELISDRALRFVARHIPGTRIPFDKEHSWYVLIDVAQGSDGGLLEHELMRSIEDDLALDVIVAKSHAEADALWRLRHSISEAQKHEGASLKHDISVPVGSIGEFLERAQSLVDKIIPDARLCTFGHVGDGNLHYNVSQPKDGDIEEFKTRGADLSNAIYDLVAEIGGSFSAEHGVGILKKECLARYRSATELDLMQSLKRALDPLNTLNPGKVI